jgi:PBSX family phage terminase large subunit
MIIDIPAKLHPLYSTDKRFIDIYGGRGSGKSHGVGTFLLAESRLHKKRSLCCREIQRSIKDSVWQLLTEKIDYYRWDYEYDITDAAIIHKKTRSDFIFKGLRGNAQDIKSTEGIDYAWVEEAMSVSRKSLEVLVPTVRNPGSQIIFTYNPTLEEDPVHVDYTLADRNDTLKIEMNWRDNPWFPEVLRADMEYDKATNLDKYWHVWEGQVERYSNDQIGAFQSVPTWDCQYCVAFIDPSFSNRTGTDSTACGIVGVSNQYMVYTGMLWPKSISDPQTMRELLDFLNEFTPIVTVLESQQADSTVFMLDALKRMESIYKIKNLWETKHQTRNKHERIMSTVGVQKGMMRILEGTQQEFSLQVSRYRKDIDHDDAPDSLAGAIETLGNSPIIAEYAKAIGIIKGAK